MHTDLVVAYPNGPAASLRNVACEIHCIEQISSDGGLVLWFRTCAMFPDSSTACVRRRELACFSDLRTFKREPACNPSSRRQPQDCTLAWCTFELAHGHAPVAACEPLVFNTSMRQLRSATMQSLIIACHASCCMWCRCAGSMHMSMTCSCESSGKKEPFGEHLFDCIGKLVPLPPPPLSRAPASTATTMSRTMATM